MERAGFKQFATLEADHWWFRGRRDLYVPLLADVLERDLGRPPAGLALADVGCGVGGFLGPMARFGPVVGLEVDEPAIAWCRGRGHGRTLVAACEALPFPRGSLDLVTLWDVLEHTPDDRAVLAECARILRPGGHLALSLPAYQFLYSNNDRVARHFRRYTRGGIMRLLRETGYEIRKATYVNVLLAPFIVPLVLAVKLKQRWLPVDDDPSTNLTWPTPRLGHDLLAAVFRSERRWLRHLSSPFGHSVFVVARRPETTA